VGMAAEAGVLDASTGSAKLNPTAAAQQYPPFLIGPGDTLNITVYGEKDLPVLFLVDSSGTIVFPLAGAVQVGGLTQVEASQSLAKKLVAYLKQPDVTVLVADTAQYTISVLGNVARPGKYRIRGLPNLLSALSEAGGPLQHSALDDSILIHGDQHRRVPLSSFLVSSADAKQAQPLLYPGDVLYVPTSPWPTVGEWGIIAGILTSSALVAVSLKNR
jgi:polysaccharide export outer membrane protein